MITKKGFTLIELLISITIIVFLTMSVYAPYNYYQNKAKLKITTRDISQLLFESRNMAINWAVWNLGNVSIWVYFDTSFWNNNIVKVFSYPYNIEEQNINNINLGETQLIKELILRKWIEIIDLEWKDNLLFIFESITWKLTYYSWNSGNKTILNDDIIDIKFWYKWSTSDNLSRTINYFTNTNIIEY